MEKIKNCEMCGHRDEWRNGWNDGHNCNLSRCNALTFRIDGDLPDLIKNLTTGYIERDDWDDEFGWVATLVTDCPAWQERGEDEKG